MSGLFQQIELKWRDRNYVIPASRVLRAVARVEDVVTVQQLLVPDQVPMAKVAMAYGSLLRYAGARVEDEEVYQTLFGGAQSNALVAVTTLLQLMLPPQVRKALEERAEAEEKPAPQEGAQAEGKDAVTSPAS